MTVFEPLPHRRAAAAALGAAVADPAEAADPGALRALVGEGAAVAFEIAGSSEAVQLAMAATWPGGRVVLGGIPDDDTTTFRAAVARRKGLTIAMVRRMNEVYPRAIALAASKKVDLDLAGHRPLPAGGRGDGVQPRGPPYRPQSHHRAHDLTGPSRRSARAALPRRAAADGDWWVTSAGGR